EGLWNHFSKFGKVDAYTIICDVNRISCDYVFFTFEDSASANTVMIWEPFLNERAIYPKHVIPCQEH
ncbi:hypothetical protein EI94DRAFT_1447819, partial [Lactarius quietus]